MNKFVGMGFQILRSVIFALRCSAIDALAVFPCVLDAIEADVSFRLLELAYRILACRRLGAVDASARKEACQLRNRNPVKLVTENVVDTLLQIGDFPLQSGNQPLCDLTQEHPGLAGGIEEFRFGALEKLLRKHVEHSVHDIRRREHLVVGKIRKASEHIRIVRLAE